MVTNQPRKVDLEQVSRILLLYCEALASTKLRIASCKNEGWLIHPEVPDQDNTTILLPLYVDRYGSAAENFAWYKISATHQVGHIEFGTYDFSLEKLTGQLNKQHLPPATSTSTAGIDAFFSLFADSKLAAAIFKVVEDIRIDYLVKHEYVGIRDVYRQIQLESLSNKPPINALDRRQAFLEILTGISLDNAPVLAVPDLTALLPSAVRVAQELHSPGATVYNSLEATVYLYDKLSSFDNPPAPQERESGNNASIDEIKVIADDFIKSALGKNSSASVSRDTESDLSDKPLAEAGADNPNARPITQKDVERFVNWKIDPTEVLRDHLSSSGFYVSEFISSRLQAAGDFAETNYENTSKSGITTLSDAQEKNVPSFLYDEWNFRTGSYLPNWCRVREIPFAPGNTGFFRDTLAKNSVLAKQIHQQFARLVPQQLKKLNRIQDGDEFDLDAVIEAVQERKVGHKLNDNVYSKMIRPRRDVAVVFLIDMSASTSEVFRDSREKQPEILSSHGVLERRRRVIDVAKESIVLMVSALEILHDCYGIYGFSSSGRDNVELHVVKGIGETFSPVVASRIDRIRPLFSTRMGPAIRHAASKLEVRHERTKILFLVSDGFPEDRDYGLDSADKQYAIRDTEMAFVEAKRKDIVPFCLTIDATGYDFLKEMSHHIEHQVIRSVASLPARLPTLYKRLTS